MSVFREKVCIITGGASGIGQALGCELGKRGAKVILADINGELLDTVVAAEQADGWYVKGERLDVSDFEAVKRVVDKTAEQEGRLDYVFNNAGIAIVGEARDVTIDHWRQVLDVNLNGVIHGITAALPIMVKQGFGHLVSVASGEGLTPFPGTASYVASKFAVVGLSGSLWMELRELGIDVSVVCPGLVKTPLLTDTIRMHKADYHAWYDSLKPFHPFSITPEVCAKRILKGVEKKKHIIIPDTIVRPTWWIYRLSPSMFMKIYCRVTRKARKAIRKVN